MSGNNQYNSDINLPAYRGNNGRNLCCKAIILLLLLLQPALSIRAETINILTFEEPPYALMRGRTQKGILVEILAELFSRTSLEYTLSFIPLKRAILTVENNPGYCILPITRSQDREASFQWVSPMLISRYGLYSQEKGSISLVTLNDALPYTIDSVQGSGTGQYLINLGFIKVELAPSSTLNPQKLQRGRFELWAEDLLSAQEMMRQQHIKLGKPELIFYTSIRAMACHRSMPLEQLEALQKALLTMYQDGFMKTLYLKYGVEI